MFLCNRDVMINFLFLCALICLLCTLTWLLYAHIDTCLYIKMVCLLVYVLYSVLRASLRSCYLLYVYMCRLWIHFTYLLTYLDDKYMLPTKFRIIWLSGLRGEDFFKSTNKKQLWIQLAYAIESPEIIITQHALLYCFSFVIGIKHCVLDERGFRDGCFSCFNIVC